MSDALSMSYIARCRYGCGSVRFWCSQTVACEYGKRIGKLIKKGCQVEFISTDVARTLQFGCECGKPSAPEKSPQSIFAKASGLCILTLPGRLAGVTEYAVTIGVGDDEKRIGTLSVFPAGVRYVPCEERDLTEPEQAGIDALQTWRAAA